MTEINQNLVRVFEIPEFNGELHFNGPSVESFLEYDFFNACFEEGLLEFIERKPYYRNDKAYLVLGKNFTFTINY